MAKQSGSESPDYPQAVFSAPPPQNPPRLARADFGQSNFDVRYDPALGIAGQKIAQGVLQTAEGDLAKLVSFFGFAPKKLPIKYIITANDPIHGGPLGGAIHFPTQEIYCTPVNLDTGQIDEGSTDCARMLAVAELVEDFEVWQGLGNNGWVLDHTNGEGLSRLLASALYPTVIPLTRAAVVNGYIAAGMPDCINDNSHGDTDNDFNGGAVLFLNWLTTQLGYDYDQVVQEPAGTLAGTYKLLQGTDDAYQRFLGDLQLVPQPLTTDNPFPVFPASFNARTRFHVERPAVFAVPTPGNKPSA
jgi:hypothetical protein